MSNTLSPYYKRIIREQIATGQFASEGEVIRHSLRLADTMRRAADPHGGSFSGLDEVEHLLLEALDSGSGMTMTATRKKRIYQQALGGVSGYRTMPRLIAAYVWP